MEFIQNKEIIVIFDKRMGLDTIASKLALLNGDQTKKFFMERLIKIPRKINAMALTSALNERIKTLDSHSLSRDAFMKLESYATFTEFQLQNLFEKIGTDEDYYLYRKNLWKLLLCNHVGINLQDGEVTRLVNMRKTAIESFSVFSKAIFPVTLDSTKEFDAYPKDALEVLLRDSFSQEEIRTLASKYGFEIPERFKKDDLLSFVKEMMKSRKKLTLALQRELNVMTISQLNEFCSLQGLGISSQMKKDELINLFLFLVKNAKFSAIEAKKIYGLPLSEPLKFRVELGAIDSFKRGLPKKVIYLEEDEIDEFQKLDELIEEEAQVKKTNSNEEVVTGVIKKLFPYLNVDADTAKVASQHGISVTPVEEPKKTVKAPKSPKTKKIIITQEKRIATPTNTQTIKTEQVKGKVDQALLDEIMKKFHGMKSNESISTTYEDKKNDQALLDEILDKLQKITDAQEKIKEELHTTKQEKTLVTEHKVHITRRYDDDGLPYDFIDEDDVDDDEFSDYNFEPEEDPEEILEELRQVTQRQGLDADELIARLKEETHEQTTVVEETIDEVSPVENESMIEPTALEDVVLSENEESSEENLQNESYDKEFEPKEETSPLDDLPKEDMMPTEGYSTFAEGIPAEPKEENVSLEPELENNPYFRKKKILSNKKPLVVTLLSIVLCIGIFISIFAIMHALK